MKLALLLIPLCAYAQSDRVPSSEIEHPIILRSLKVGQTVCTISGFLTKEGHVWITDDPASYYWPGRTGCYSWSVTRLSGGWRFKINGEKLLQRDSLDGSMAGWIRMTEVIR